MTDPFEEAYRSAGTEIGRFNLAVFGKTGVGKSTLINAVFGRQVAQTGIGKPVTLGSHLYVHETGKLGVYDTQGLEIGRDTSNIVSELAAFIRSTEQRPLSERVHLAWYCVRASDRRFEQTEADFISKVASLGLPVVVVLTQTPARSIDGVLQYSPDSMELSRQIEALNLPIHGNKPIPVNALADTFTGVEQHGLLDLLEATFRNAPDSVSTALTAAQKIDFARKAAAADKVIGTAVTAASATAFTPIPFSDAAILVPIQLGMMARIAHLYDIGLDTAAMASIAATAGATQAGRFAATGLLKLVPGVGTLVGGSIAAGVAGAMTFAMGKAWVRVCEALATGRLTGDGRDAGKIQDLFTKVFSEELRRRLGRN